MSKLTLNLIAVAAFLAAGSANAEDADTVQTMLKDTSGTNVGVATLTDTPHGVLISVDFAGMTPGEHAFHIHEVGKCEPPFKSAGEHLNPTHKAHGFASGEGYHAGDLPNIVIPESGKAKIEAFAANVRLRSGAVKLFDSDGSALVVHAGVDDYRSQPAGAAGERIACGVLEPLQNVTVEDLEVAP
jgi:Cu-Zn family superoxide dismutase